MVGHSYPATYPDVGHGNGSYGQAPYQQGQRAGFHSQQRQPVLLPPGKNDLEILENLKQIIKNGQHQFYRAVPQPESLARLYLGKIPTTEAELAERLAPKGPANPDAANGAPKNDAPGPDSTSPVDTRRPPRLKNKESWESNNRRASVSNGNELASPQNGGPSNNVQAPAGAKDAPHLNGKTSPTKPTITVPQDPNAMDVSPDYSPTGIDIPTDSAGGPSSKVPASPSKPDMLPSTSEIPSSEPTSRLPPPSSNLPDKPNVDSREAPGQHPNGWQGRHDHDRPLAPGSGYQPPSSRGGPDARGPLASAPFSRDDKPYDRDNRDRDFANRNRRDWADRRPYDRFPRNNTDMRRPPPEERHYEPPTDRVLPPRRYDHFVKTEEVPISLSDLEPRPQDVRPPASFDNPYPDDRPPVNRDFIPSTDSYDGRDFIPRGPSGKDGRHIVPPGDDHPPRGPGRAGGDTSGAPGRGPNDDAARGPIASDGDFVRNDGSRSLLNQDSPSKSQPDTKPPVPAAVDDGNRDGRDVPVGPDAVPVAEKPLHRNGSISDASRPANYDRQSDRFAGSPTAPKGSHPARDDRSAPSSRVPPSPGLPRPPVQRDYRGHQGDGPRSYRPPPNIYRPTYDSDRRPDRMDVDDSRYVDSRSYRPYSPPPDVPRDRARQLPPSPSRPVADPHYDDRRYGNAPPAGAAGRDWYGQQTSNYQAQRRWEEDTYYKDRGHWEAPLDRDRYDRDGLAQPPVQAWDRPGDRDARYPRGGPPGAPPIDDRYAPPTRPPPPGGPSQPYTSRVRARSPSPLRRGSGPIIDDSRPPHKRPRDDYPVAPPPSDYYAPRGEPMRRQTGEYSPTGPPPSSGGSSSFYPPPSTASTVGGDRDYGRRDSVMEYMPPPPHSSYSRPRSPSISQGGRAPAPPSAPYDRGQYGRPNPRDGRGSYMPPRA